MTGSQGMFMRRDTRPTDTSWHELGRCHEEDDTLFYHPENERGSTRLARADAAKAVCRECPVRMVCREQSLANRESHGTWGGLSEDERSLLLAGKPIEGPLHDHPRLAPVPRQKAAAKPRARTQGGSLVLTCRDIPITVKRSRVADPRVVAHVQQLVAAGHKVQEIALVAGVTTDTVRTVARGAQIVTRRTSALLRAVQPALEVAA
jgi:WhiB family redox-sensing transcriptional regulator